MFVCLWYSFCLLVLLVVLFLDFACPQAFKIYFCMSSVVLVFVGLVVGVCLSGIIYVRLCDYAWFVFGIVLLHNVALTRLAFVYFKYVVQICVLIINVVILTTCCLYCVLGICFDYLFALCMFVRYSWVVFGLFWYCFDLFVGLVVVVVVFCCIVACSCDCYALCVCV